MNWLVDGLLPRRRRARRWTRQGNAARDRGDWPMAREAYAQALAAAPERDRIWVQYGHATKEAGDVAAAEVAYRRALQLRPDSADAQLQLGHALKLLGRMDEALACYLRATTLAPGEAEYQRQLDQARQAMARDQAARAARRQEEEDQGKAVSVLDLAVALHASADPKAAAAAYRRAFRLQPDQPDTVWLRYAEAAAAAGEIEPAIAGYQRALELRPGVATVHLGLGKALGRLNRMAAAAEAFGEVARLAPGVPEHHLRLGEALQRLGLTERAAAAFAHAAQAATGDALRQAALGEMLAAMDQPALALAAFDQALALDPANPASQAGRQAAFAALPPLDLPNGATVGIEAVRWAMRLFLGREPATLAEADLHCSHANLDALRRAFAATEESAAFHRQAARPDYAAPLFLLGPPQRPEVPWALAPPSFARLSSQLCTAGQLEEPAYAEWCGRLGISATPHRKPWEFCFTAAALNAEGLLRSGSRGLGFGCGQEPLPAYFAGCGVAVLATDAPAEVVASQGEHITGGPQPAPPAIVEGRVTRCPLDMNRIPAELTGFDFCWSAGALQHLGSLRAGMDFIVASLATLRPGGIAVHTTEFNLGSDTATAETAELSIFRRQDIELLILELVAAGHSVAKFNTHPGDRPMDAHIDLPPFALPHLKLLVAGQVTTSLGLIIRKARG